MFNGDDSHYAKKKIADITNQDTKLQVVGEVIDTLSETEYEISDGTGQVKIILKHEEPLVDQMRDGIILKVLGTLIGDSADIISVDFVKDYSDLEFDLYKKSLDLKAKYLE